MVTHLGFVALLIDQQMAANGLLQQRISASGDSSIKTLARQSRFAPLEKSAPREIETFSSHIQSTQTPRVSVNISAKVLSAKKDVSKATNLDWLIFKSLRESRRNLSQTYSEQDLIKTNNSFNARKFPTAIPLGYKTENPNLHSINTYLEKVPGQRNPDAVPHSGISGGNMRMIHQFKQHKAFSTLQPDTRDISNDFGTLRILKQVTISSRRTKPSQVLYTDKKTRKILKPLPPLNNSSHKAVSSSVKKVRKGAVIAVVSSVKPDRHQSKISNVPRAKTMNAKIQYQNYNKRPLSEPRKGKTGSKMLNENGRSYIGRKQVSGTSQGRNTKVKNFPNSRGGQGGDILAIRTVDKNLTGANQHQWKYHIQAPDGTGENYWNDDKNQTYDRGNANKTKEGGGVHVIEYNISEDRTVWEADDDMLDAQLILHKTAKNTKRRLVPKPTPQTKSKLKYKALMAKALQNFRTKGKAS